MRITIAVLAILVAALVVSPLGLLSAPSDALYPATSSFGAAYAADADLSGRPNHITGEDAALPGAEVHGNEEEGEEGGEAEEKEGEDEEEDPAAERLWDLVMLG